MNRRKTLVVRIVIATFILLLISTIASPVYLFHVASYRDRFKQLKRQPFIYFCHRRNRHRRYRKRNNCRTRLLDNKGCLGV